MMDLTRYIGPTYNDFVQKLLDDRQTKYLGIKLITPFTLVLVALIGAAVVVALYRLAFGIGAASNLSDAWPWGLWISFDVLGGVCMAAGGFLIAGAVYILGLEKYHCVARAAILNAFFGYLLAAISICMDIGRSVVIWKALISSQINSIMFIVALHVVLYTSTLATESSPMFFEKVGWDGARNKVSRCMVGVALFGVLLSLLHQSSLGAVYLIAPGKLSPIWYSQWIPYCFLLSAIMLGLSMVSFETILTGKVWNHPPPRDVLSGLGRGILITGMLYLALKVYILLDTPGLVNMVFDGSFLGNLYLLEMAVGVVLPVIFLSFKAVRNNIHRLFAVDILVVAGVLLNRLNVGIFGVQEFATRSGGDYFPSMMEWILTLGMIAFAILGFKLCAKYLNLFPQH